MSDGPGDMNRELEKKAAEMVEKCCNNCKYKNTSPWDMHCVKCVASGFIPSHGAISAKLEELRNQTVIKQDSNSKSEESGEKEGGESKKSIWRDPKKEPVEKGIHFLLTTFMGGFDWTDQVEGCDFSQADGYMYFSDLCKVLKAYPQIEKEREEMLAVLKECRIELSSSCERSCDFYGTPDCSDDCNTNELKKRIQTIIKKAEGR